MHATTGVQSVATTCCNKAGCSKVVHMDLNLRCLADSNQLQISMMVATMRQVVLHAVFLISRTAGAWVLAAAPHTVAGHACLAALQAHA